MHYKLPTYIYKNLEIKLRLMIQAFGSWTLFWDIYELLWWFLLGFELLNPNPFGARLQMLSIFSIRRFSKMAAKFWKLAYLGL